MNDPRWWSDCWAVLRKELLDILRDRRTLAMIFLGAIATGPFFLLTLSTMLGELEARSQSREVFALGIEAAPSLANVAARHGYVVREPGDGVRDTHALASALAERRLQNAVLVVPADFEAVLASGRAPRLALWTASGNDRAAASEQAWQGLIQAWRSEQAGLRLAWRGVSPQLLQVVEVDRHDAAGTRQKHAQLLRMLPFFILMGMLYGAMHAALDATAGERERGTLEPLQLTSASPGAVVLGKWLAVSLITLGIAALSCLSFLPAGLLVRSPALAAALQFGWREALQCIALLAPLAMCLGALLMVVAARSQSVREAQAAASIVVMVVSLMPMLLLFGNQAEAAWQSVVPGVAQLQLMQHVLEGEAPGWRDAVPPSVAALAVAVALLPLLRRMLLRTD